jgi:hypothetical protein
MPSRFRGRTRRDAAAFYLSELARGILAGELGVRVGHETIPVKPPDFVILSLAPPAALESRGHRSRAGTTATERPCSGGHLEFTSPSF